MRTTRSARSRLATALARLQSAVPSDATNCTEYAWPGTRRPSKRVIFWFGHPMKGRTAARGGGGLAQPQPAVAGDGAARPTSELKSATAASPADAVMVDPKDPTDPGARSAPIPVEWLAGVHHEHLIVAGGLTPSSVGTVVRTLHPWGVDVSGGVEESPGRKDARLVRDFVAEVRAAERR